MYLGQNNEKWENAIAMFHIKLSTVHSIFSSAGKLLWLAVPTSSSWGDN